MELALRLAPHVHAIALDDDLVLLDARADAYLCAPGAASAVRLDPRTDAITVADEALAEDFRAAGLVVQGATPSPRPAPPPLPSRSALTDTYARPRVSDLGQALAPVLGLLRHYRARSFLEILRSVPAASDAARAPPGPALLDAVARFHRWVPYAPVPGKCLPRSWLLREVLRREGLEAQWVFGVATWPFRAHCWLQAGDTALDDHAERLRAYAPILVV